MEAGQSSEKVHRSMQGLSVELTQHLLHCIQLSKQVTVQIKGMRNRLHPRWELPQSHVVKGVDTGGVEDCGHLSNLSLVPSRGETLSSGGKKHKSCLQGVLRQWEGCEGSRPLKFCSISVMERYVTSLELKVSNLG